MPNYQRIANRLIIALSEIIDDAMAAIEEAEENIISDEANVQLGKEEKEAQDV